MKPFRGKRMPLMYLRGYGLVCVCVGVLHIRETGMWCLLRRCWSLPYLCKQSQFGSGGYVGVYRFCYGDRGILAETTSGLRNYFDQFHYVAVVGLSRLVDLSNGRFKLVTLLHSFWRKDSVIIGGICPVLKHGPRSLTCARVCELKIHGRNESDRYDWPKKPCSNDRPWSMVIGLSMSAAVRTRKMVNFTWVGWSQGKLWWRLVAILTCKSIVKSG